MVKLWYKSTLPDCRVVWNPTVRKSVLTLFHFRLGSTWSLELSNDQSFGLELELRGISNKTSSDKLQPVSEAIENY
jgi:hypothetical protein